MNGEKFIRIIVGNKEKAIWRISESQWQVILALQDLGAIPDDTLICELDIELMD